MFVLLQCTVILMFTSIELQFNMFECEFLIFFLLFEHEGDEACPAVAKHYQELGCKPVKLQESDVCASRWVIILIFFIFFLSSSAFNLWCVTTKIISANQYIIILRLCRFDCPDFTSFDKTKCNFQGKSYNVGESISADTHPLPTCTKKCTCKQ